MNRRDFVLAVIAVADAPMTPVQVQKLFFILDQKIPTLIGGPLFNFVPYNYGPFDPRVYGELDALAAHGLVSLSTAGSTRSYVATSAGARSGELLFQQLPRSAQSYIRALVAWLKTLSFKQLVSAVYDQWPAMKANSIFRG